MKQNMLQGKYQNKKVQLQKLDSNSPFTDEEGATADNEKIEQGSNI